jgi:hypothetical protein
MQANLPKLMIFLREVIITTAFNLLPHHVLNLAFQKRFYIIYHHIH